MSFHIGWRVARDRELPRRSARYHVKFQDLDISTGNSLLSGETGLADHEVLARLSL